MKRKAILLLPILFALGCPRKAAMVRPYDVPTPARLADALAEHQRALQGMNARVRATSWLGGERIRATVLMLVERPARLRFEAEVSLQGTVAILATDGTRFGMLDLTHNELRQGPACPANVASLIRIPLAPADIAAILLADLRLPDPALSRQGDVSVDWDPARGADVLVLPRLDGWLRVLFQPTSPTASGIATSGWRILGATATARDGSPRWRVSYEDFTSVSLSASGASAEATRPTRLEFPQTIRFAEGATSFDEGVEIKFKERTFNEPAATGAFVLDAPGPGISTIEVGCP